MKIFGLSDCQPRRSWVVADYPEIPKIICARGMHHMVSGILKSQVLVSREQLVFADSAFRVLAPVT